MKLFVATVLAFALTVLQVPRTTGSTVLASDTTCAGILVGAVVIGDLVVPPGSFCIIVRSFVHGSVKVMPNASGFASNGSLIYGSVESPGPTTDVINLLETTVGGSVFIAGMPSTAIFGASCGSSVRGDFTLKGNQGRYFLGPNPVVVCPEGNTIHGSLMLLNNPGGDFGLAANDVLQDFVVVGNGPGSDITITGNRIGNTLKCFDNSPTPVSAGNTAKTKEGQCTL